MTRRDRHPPCPGGCGELADECACTRPRPLGSMELMSAIDAYIAETLPALIPADPAAYDRIHGLFCTRACEAAAGLVEDWDGNIVGHCVCRQTGPKDAA